MARSNTSLFASPFPLRHVGIGSTGRLCTPRSVDGQYLWSSATSADASTSGNGPPIEGILQAGVTVERPGGEAEQAIDRDVGLGSDVAEGVERAMVGDGGLVRGGVIGGQVADAAQVVAECPEDILRAAVVDHLVGHQLVRARTPEVAMGQVARFGIVGRAGGVLEVEDDLVAVVDEDRGPN